MIRAILQKSFGVLAIAALTACSAPQSNGATHEGSHSAGTATSSPTAVSDDHGAADHAVAGGQRVSGHGTHDYKPPDISAMSGAFQLVNAKTGAAYSEKDLRGSWTLLYMGYIECLEACPIAMKTMPQAVDELNARGVQTKAVFIDINAPRLDDLSGGVAHNTNKAADKDAHGEGHPASHSSSGAGDVPVNELTLTGPEVRRMAIAEWGKTQDPDVILLSGSRKQVLAAGTLFKSRAEQTMMPTNETIHHINHTTYIYGIDPQGDVVVLLYHSDSPSMIVNEIVAASQARVPPT